MTPMAQGLRLTTGAEFARLDDPPSTAHLDRLEPFAREMFPARGAQGGKTLARPPPLPARHAPRGRAISRPAGPLARLRPPPPRPDARADQRPAHRRDDGGRTDGRRSRPVPARSGSGRSILMLQLRATPRFAPCLHTRRVRRTANAPRSCAFVFFVIFVTCRPADAGIGNGRQIKNIGVGNADGRLSTMVTDTTASLGPPGSRGRRRRRISTPASRSSSRATRRSRP